MFVDNTCCQRFGMTTTNRGYKPHVEFVDRAKKKKGLSKQEGPQT